MRNFRELTEATGTVVFTFGRFNISELQFEGGYSKNRHGTEKNSFFKAPKPILGF